MIKSELETTDKMIQFFLDNSKSLGGGIGGSEKRYSSTGKLYGNIVWRCSAKE